jgi:hypothetical protein
VPSAASASKPAWEETLRALLAENSIDDIASIQDVLNDNGAAPVPPKKITKAANDLRKTQHVLDEMGLSRRADIAPKQKKKTFANTIADEQEWFDLKDSLRSHKAKIAKLKAQCDTHAQGVALLDETIALQKSKVQVLAKEKGLLPRKSQDVRDTINHDVAAPTTNLNKMAVKEKILHFKVINKKLKEKIKMLSSDRERLQAEAAQQENGRDAELQSSNFTAGESHTSLEADLAALRSQLSREHAQREETIADNEARIADLQQISDGLQASARAHVARRIALEQACRAV